MLFNYEAITNTGEKKTGAVDATSKDLAIAAIQRRGYIVSSIKENVDKKGMFNFSFFGKRTNERCCDHVTTNVYTF